MTFGGDINIFSHSLLSSLAYLLDCIAIYLQNQKRVRLHMLLSEEFLAVWFNLFIYPTGIDRMLVEVSGIPGAEPLDFRSSPSRRREKLVSTMAWCPCPDKIHITQYAHAEEG